jgi:hypothetical protein
MRRVLFCCLVVVAASAHAATVSNEVLASIFEKISVEVKSVDEIRPEIFVELGYLAHDQHLKLANSGERFNATDSVDERLPDRALCFAARSPDDEYLLICYYRGGYGLQQCAVLFRSLNPKKADLTRAMWAATIPHAHRCKNLEDLRTAIQNDNVVSYPLPFDVF